MDNMGLFSKKRETEDTTDPKEMLRLRDEALEKGTFFLNTIKSLLSITKDFAVDSEEINTERFKTQMTELSNALTFEQTTGKLEKVYEKHKKIILTFIRRTKEYLIDREKEFKDIIEILTQGIKAINKENITFNDQIFEQSDKFEKLAYLDDIRKIKDDLKLRVAEVRKLTKEKQELDSKRINEMSRKVEYLEVNLKEAEEASMKDGLTGAFNRKAFDTYMNEFFRQHSKRRKDFSLLLMDIDNFKRINDTYGHQVGDRVLMALVHQCNEFVRKDDLLARYGGEEFAILLPGASLKNGVKRANTIRLKIATSAYAVDASSREAQLSFTISIGVSSMRGDDSVESMIKRADECLYLAKRTGKNRVVSENELM